LLRPIGTREFYSCFRVVAARTVGVRRSTRQSLGSERSREDRIANLSTRETGGVGSCVA